MATPIRIKRSTQSGKRPNLDHLQKGELAINIADGHLFAERDTGGVGIGTTVTLLTPWQEEYGGGTIGYGGTIKVDKIYVGTGNSIGISSVLDEDDLVSDSDTALATQQSIKKYVDAEVLTVATGLANNTLEFEGDNTGIGGTVVLTNQTFTISGTDNEVVTSGAGTTITVGLSSDVLISTSVGIGTTQSNSTLDVNGSLNVSGISTFQDKVIFDSTNSIQIPVGTESEKDEVGVAVTGQIRYNTTNSQFEGFGPGNDWGSLGGVKDVDGDTYVKAESSPGSDEDALTFFTGSTERAVIDSNGNVGIATTNPTSRLDLRGTLSVSGVSTFSGDLTVGTASTGVVARTDGTLNVTGVSTFSGDLTVGTASTGVVARTDGTLNVTGVSTFSGDVSFGSTATFGDNVKLSFGTGQDLQIYHSSNINRIEADQQLFIKGTNINLYKTGSSEKMASFIQDGAVELYYDAVKKFETTGYGVSVTDGLNVSGISTFADNVILDSTNAIQIPAGTTEERGFRVLETKTGNVSGVGTNRITGINTSGIEQNQYILGPSGVLRSGTQVTFVGIGSIGIGLTALAPSSGGTFKFGTISVVAGQIRYNSELSSFEGYGPGNTWGSLGGIKDVDQDTYITAESSAGSDEDKLTFYTAGVERVGVDSTGNVGIGTTSPTAKLDVVGVVSATSFYGDGTNLDLTDSVALGGDTTGDYVQSISGTPNQIAVDVTSGEGSSPQIGLPDDVTIGQDLTVLRNLQVDGNITVGGTSATLFTETLKVSDADLILGIRTDANGDDISTDTTASHGGIAIASTDGSPLVTLVNPGAGETLPATYKKIMWFKKDSFAGLGTDAWLINYGVGIGSTQVPDGVRLAAGGVHISETNVKAKTFESTIAIGTAPFTVASTTLVSNLNADKLDGQEGTHYLDYTNFTNTPTIPAVNDATLTLSTSGDGISGDDTFTANQSTDTTFTVTVSSASTNQASTLVYRDTSGGFSAGIITASNYRGSMSDRFIAGLDAGGSTGVGATINSIIAVGSNAAKDFGNTSYSLPDGDLVVIGGNSLSNSDNTSRTGRYIDSVVVGYDNLKKAESSEYNVIVGDNIGAGLTSPTVSTLIGSNIAVSKFGSNHTWSQNIAIGFMAMPYVDGTTTNNIVLGERSGAIRNGSNNILLGERVGQLHTNTNGSIGIGYSALNRISGGTGNIGIGSEAGGGSSNLTGDGNIFIGRKSGYNVTTGNGNVVLVGGNSTQPVNVPLVEGDRQLVIGAASTAWIHGDSSYNIGIGTTNPTQKLHVSGVIVATGGSSTDWNTAHGWGDHSTQGYLTSGDLVQESQDLNDVVGLGSSTDQTITVGTASTGIILNPNGDLKVTGISTFNSDITIGGNIKYGSQSNIFIKDGTTTKFTFEKGQGDFTAVGNVTAYSDIKLKDSIKPIESAVDKVMKISGVTYTRNDLDDKNKRHAGVIAQEIEQVLPEVVNTDSNGTKSVAYGNLVALLIEAIKEQQEQINILRGGK